MASQLTEVNLTITADQVKMNSIQETFEKHMALMEALNKKSDAQGSAIMESRKIFGDKLHDF